MTSSCEQDDVGEGERVTPLAKIWLIKK